MTQSTAISPHDADSAFLEELGDALGAQAMTRDPDLVTPWLTDWRGRYHGAALAMVSPRSTADVARLVQICARHRVPIVPQGGNSGMCGGATPDASGRAVLLSLRQMNAIRRLDAEAGLVVADAGLVLQNLHEAAEAQGRRFPLTLGGKGSATIGGLVSTNAGGTQVLRHGNMRQLVLGIEAVMPDGSIIDELAVLKKDNRGYDLKQLLIGAEGTLGIVTAATLKLVPALIDRCVAWIGVADIHTARRLLLFLESRAATRLEGFEILPDHCLANVLAHEAKARAPLAGPHAWHVLIELVRDSDAQSPPHDLAESLLADAMEAGLIEDATLAANESQADAFWLLRDSISAAERAHGPAMQHDISVPVERMADFIDFAVPDVEARFAGTRAVAFGHMGDGNVHFHVIAPKGSDPVTWPEAQGKAISAHVHDLVVGWSGSISAEHGIGQMKRDELARLDSAARIAAMRGVKAALDPLGIMNPGKVISTV